MEELINEFRDWLRNGTVPNQYNQYVDDLTDIRNGILGNLNMINNEAAKQAFESQSVIEEIQKNSLNVDIFVLTDKLIENLKKFKTTFLKPVCTFQTMDQRFRNEIRKYAVQFIIENQRINNGRPYAAFNRYIDFLEEKTSKKKVIPLIQKD